MSRQAHDFGRGVRTDLYPEGRQAAVCFSIDDVHPGKSTDAYEAGGDCQNGALGLVERLLRRHEKARVTLFTTPDWREVSARPTRKFLGAVPWLRNRLYLARTLPAGTMRLDRHPEFVAYVKHLPRVEIALHGLHHVHRGPHIPVEFQEQNVEECAAILKQSMAIFAAADLPFVPGLNPPGWQLPDALAEAMVRTGLTFVASARDIVTEISRNARANMSGMKGVSLLFPQEIQDGRLLHFTSNFQATSPIDRAFRIIENGGVLSIKAHVVKNAAGHIALDGVDILYCNYLDALFSELERRYGETLWWTSMGEMAARWSGSNASRAAGVTSSFASDGR